MRETKFRAFDSQNNEWLYAELKNGKKSFTLTVSNPLSLYLDDRPSYNYTNTVWCLNDDELIWVQFTGMQDKNGVEIYEGDIVCNEGFKEEVKWDKFYGWIVSDEQMLGEANFARIEVIGNIYENHELLK